MDDGITNAQEAGPVDGQGRPFDRALHLVHPKGPRVGLPVIHHTTGRLIMKPAYMLNKPAPTATPTVTPAALPTATTDDIILELADQGPVQHEAGPAVESTHPHLQDRHGNAFDPEIHVTENGQPKLSAAGRLIGKPGVRVPRPGAGPAPRQARAMDLSGLAGGAGALPGTGDAALGGDPISRDPAPAPVMTVEQRTKLAKETAVMTVQLLQAVGRFFGGKEGTFKSDDENGDEKRELTESYESWLSTMENLVHVSPGWLVALNTGKYLGRVAQTETAQRRIEKGTSWITSLGSKVRLAWHTWRATSNAKKES